MNQDPKPDDEDEDEDDKFYRRFVLCEEDRLHRYPHLGPSIGFRWFRSPNIIPIEKARRRRQKREGTL
jgi:hypothetical protein